MDGFTQHDLTHKSGEVTHYYSGGNQDGTPLLFIHGWPDIAEAWHHQLTHFASKGTYRIICPDMRGYGGSTAPKTREAYSLEALTNELVDLAAELNIAKAVWIGHDWGAAVVASLAGQHPELFLGLGVLCVPYRTLELGLKPNLDLVNRDIYPADEYPYGQFEYQVYYEQHWEESVKAWDDNIDRITKVLYTPNKPEEFGKPALTSRLLREGGWFGGHPELVPDIPLEYTFLTKSHYDHLLASHKKHGFFGPTAYYLNHERNAEFARLKEKNGGRLEFPVLYIDAKYDAVCSTTTTPKLGEPQRETCKDLTVEVVEAAHWVQLEKPKEVNAVLEKWLGEKIKA